MARIDHILIAVREPKRFSEELQSRYGLSSREGGRLAGLGTESHIVPLGVGFLDLISIVDEREAKSNPLGRAVTAATEEREATFIAWAVDPGSDLQSIADRLKLTVSPFKRALPDGGHITCRIAGLQQAVEEGPVPYFVEWATKPDQNLPDHCSDHVGFAWIEVSSKQAKIKDWLGEAVVPIQYAENTGSEGIEAVGILTKGEAIVIRSPLLAGSDPFNRSSIEEGLLGSQRSEGPEDTSPSAFAVVLDSIEQAIETAAEAVETMAGGVVNPHELENGSNDQEL